MQDEHEHNRRNFLPTAGEKTIQPLNPSKNKKLIRTLIEEEAEGHETGLPVVSGTMPTQSSVITPTNSKPGTVTNMPAGVRSYQAGQNGLLDLSSQKLIKIAVVLGVLLLAFFFALLLIGG